MLGYNNYNGMSYMQPMSQRQIGSSPTPLLPQTQLGAEAQRKYLNEIGVSSVICDYTPEDYESVVAGLEDQPEGGLRCLECFKLRLEKTAQFAKEKGYDVFTTTLSVSPHKDYVAINKIGKQLEEKYGVKFLEANFKKNDGYLKSIQNSKKFDIYRQNYCGCKYSLPKENKEN